jgi:glutamyl-Q tRNA(Asp) synthetase
LHVGSLIAATGSYAEALYHGGHWLLRIEDVDPPRMQAGADIEIMRLLTACGMHWHGEVLYQSTRTTAYEAVLHALQQRGLLYPCNCPRKRVKNAVYDGHCRNGMDATGKNTYALRLRTDYLPADVSFDDAIMGTFSQDISSEVGDFILKRSDGLFAYQLAVVVDDAAQGVNHIVRGNDLFDNTPRQIYLQRLLGYAEPRYLHLPVLVDQNGYKLSKQNHAPAADSRQALVLVRRALNILGQQVPPELDSLACLWEWVAAHWQRANIPLLGAISVDDY